MRRSTTTAARPSSSHHTKYCVHRSACWTGQTRYADFASTTYSAAASPSAPWRPSRAHVPMIASALASACTRGRRTTRS
eukprot:4549988-Pleurochrysis_carterae.AAC.1